MNNQRKALLTALGILVFGLFLFAALGEAIMDQEDSRPEWTAASGRLMTRWAKEVTAQNVLPEYPRPQMTRHAWLNLNGLWDLAVTGKDDRQPDRFDESILVPFPIESALSGVMRRVSEKERIWYRRSFTIPESWKAKRLLLHFGAVDWDTAVFVNGHEVGRHQGGYDAFSFEITDALRAADGEQELIVAVWDPTDKGGQARGKQVGAPRGIWYTPTSGIWQTVWIEPVPRRYIDSIRLTPDVDSASLLIEAALFGDPSGLRLSARSARSGSTASAAPHEELLLSVPEAKLWSPDNPFLYDLAIVLEDAAGREIDVVESYFAMRHASLGKDDRGRTQLMLNGKPLFQIGLLDQGFWPDGLYTAPTDAALRYDIEITKEMGFNMARKHVKVEPARWYYWCDTLGLLVWQDMPSGNNATAADREQFAIELDRLVDGLYNHPSIVMWVPFNEGWGQHETASTVERIKERDPTRLVNNASGWTDKKVGDVNDIHAYPGPRAPEPEETRAAVLGEFGGLGLPIEGHSWDESSWGYESFEDREGLVRRYEEVLHGVARLRLDPGLSAAVYTQTTDVETESNGMLSYDRAVIKIDPETVALANGGFLPPCMASHSEMFIDETDLRLECVRQGAAIHYTLDGTEPDASAARYEEPVELTATTTIKTRAFWADGIASRTATFTARRVEPIAALTAAAPKESGLRGDSQPAEVPPSARGLVALYYEGTWETLPDFANLPGKEGDESGFDVGFAPCFDLSFAKKTENFGLVLHGYITVPDRDVYTFFVSSDDGSRLFVAGRKVVDNDGLHGDREREGKIPLEAGRHPIALHFFQAAGGRALKVSWASGSMEKSEIPPNVLSW